EYALGNLATNKVYAWTPEDYKVSKEMQAYFANFIKTGNPNGAGLPTWAPLKADGTGPTLRLDVQTQLLPEAGRERYQYLNQTAAK
ncbi:MAG: carboxylesterase family protein, partial [Hymenobacter sp.]